MHREALLAESIEILRSQGATVVDPAHLPRLVDPGPENNRLAGGGGVLPPDLYSIWTDLRITRSA